MGTLVIKGLLRNLVPLTRETVLLNLHPEIHLLPTSG